jgi:hypothetical protein
MEFYWAQPFLLCAAARIVAEDAIAGLTKNPDLLRLSPRRKAGVGFRHLYRRNPRIKPQNALGPFRDAQQVMVLPVAADDLHAERQAVFAEARRQ